ncbi:MAG: YfiR family protein [bacterium]|nr:YfiR family protein [bacterium]
MEFLLRLLRVKLGPQNTGFCAVTLLILSVATCSTFPLFAQSGEEYEYPLKAQFIERFVHFVEWPEMPPDAAAGEDERFVIGVFGSSQITRHLNRLMRDKTLKDRPVHLIVINKTDQIPECDVLFIPAEADRALVDVLAICGTLPILTISDSQGFAALGVLINFYQDGEYLRFEVNRSAVENSGLRFRSNLLRLARLIGEDENP